MDNTNMICQECGAWKIPPSHPTGAVFHCPDEWKHDMRFIKVTVTTGQSTNNSDIVKYAPKDCKV